VLNCWIFLDKRGLPARRDIVASRRRAAQSAIHGLLAGSPPSSRAAIIARKPNPDPFLKAADGWGSSLDHASPWKISHNGVRAAQAPG